MLFSGDSLLIGRERRRGIIGSVSHGGNGASIRVSFLARSEGQIWRRRLESCFQRGLGADAI